MTVLFWLGLKRTMLDTIIGIVALVPNVIYSGFMQINKAYNKIAPTGVYEETYSIPTSSKRLSRPNKRTSIH